MRAKNRNPGAGDAGASGIAVPVKNGPECNGIAAPTQPRSAPCPQKNRRRVRADRPKARTVRTLPALRVYDGQTCVGAIDDAGAGDLIAYTVDSRWRFHRIGTFATRAECVRAIAARGSRNGAGA